MPRRNAASIGGVRCASPCAPDRHHQRCLCGTGGTARLSHWLLENPDHEDADDVRARETAQRAGYFNGYRNVLGMAYLGLIAV